MERMGTAMNGTSSSENVVRFPDDRRRRVSVADVEIILRERWQDVVKEPIPGRWLQLLSLFERIEAERSLARGEAVAAEPQDAPVPAQDEETGAAVRKQPEES
jgi:hypothetical protein